MKVLLVSRRFYPEIVGGGEISAFYIAQALKKAGNDVEVLTFTEGKPFSETIKDIPIHRDFIKTGKGFFRRWYNLEGMYKQIHSSIKNIIPKVNPDVIHLLNFDPIPLTAIKLKKEYNIPLFATVNGPIFGCFTLNGIDYKGRPCTNCTVHRRFVDSLHKWGLKGLLYFFYSFWYMNVLRRSYKRINKFFTVSSSMDVFLRNMGVPQERITTIHNPIEVRTRTKTDLKKKLGIGKKKVLLYAGRLSPDKGVQNVIKAMPNVDDAVYVVAGRGNYEDKLKQLAIDLGVEDKVIFTGFIEPDKTKEYYSIADIVIHTCHVYESLSRMLLEATAYGIPTIANDIGGNPAMVENNKNGLLIKSTDANEIANAINKLVADSALRKKMGAYAKNKIKENFTIGVIGEKLTNEYKSVL